MRSEPESACPDRLTLERFAVGELADEERAARLEWHVVDCEVCGQTLQSLSADDSIVAAIRSVGMRNGEDYREEIAQLVALLRDTPCPAMSLAEGLDTPDAGPAVSLSDVLAPSREQNELGWMGPFRIDAVIAAGGMGVVLRGVDLHLQREVAIKIMKPSLAGDSEARTRFLREARAMATLEDDNIVAIYQVGEQEGTPYFVMPLLRGESLGDRLRRCGALSAEEVIRIGMQMARGLSAAWARGVLHRDIKPSNVWLEAGTGRVKLLDFGLTSVNVVEDAHHAPRIVGTPGYFSPEQARGEVTDQRSDLFALGCVLYEALAGSSPFFSRDRTLAFKATLRCEPEPLTSLLADVSTGLAAIVMKLLEADPAQRFDCAEQLNGALKNELDSSRATRHRSFGRGLLIGGLAGGVLLVSLSVSWRLGTSESATSVSRQQRSKSGWPRGFDSDPQGQPSSVDESRATVARPLPGADPFAASPGPRPTGHLFVMGVDGANLRQITDASSEFELFGSPDWSPDGEQIVFDARIRRVNSESHLLLTHSGFTRIQDLGAGQMPSFSPDGRRIAFSWSTQGIAIMNSDGTDRRVIARGAWGAEWSPDGRWIASIVHDKEHDTSNVVLIDVASDERRLLLQQEDASRYSRIYWNMDWSPDSTQICLRGRLKRTGEYEVAILSVAGLEEIVPLGLYGDVLACFSWRPDGSSVLFAMKTRRFSGYRLYLIDSTTKNPLLLESQPVNHSNRSAVWSPDGTSIAFTSHPEN